ncbi:hypothetical protein ACUOA8_41705, partial [Escherichia sp. SS-MK2]
DNGVAPDTQCGITGIATITRYDKSTFTCSSACTDAVNALEWRYYWQVNMPAATNTTWMTCGDPCDSALRIWGDTVVECVLNKLCPSHTYVIFKIVVPVKLSRVWSLVREVQIPQ